MRFLLIIIIAFMFSGCGYSNDVGGTLISISQNPTIEEIAKSITPAVVGICGINGSAKSVGSGVCVAKNGYIVTNSHVVNNCEEIKLYLADKSTTTAKVIYEDTILDFAIIKSNKGMPYIRLSSDDVSVGEDILAVGTPLSIDLTHTFTKGIVSALNRTIKVTSAGGEGYMQNLIQHDASLNPGNSGGPLINKEGEIVGINTLKISGGEGIGFAIPVKSFKSLLNGYLSDEDYSPAYLGVYGVDCEIANFQGVTGEELGFYVIDIADNSPLKDVGIKGNVVIKSINKVKINNTLDFKNELYKLKKGESVMIEYVSEGVLSSTKINLK